jgi:hypothetical protein
MENFTFTGFMWRFAASLVLVFVTYNPSGHSFVHWAAASGSEHLPAQALVGIGLVAAWAFFVNSTARSLGKIGVAIAAAFFAALIWLFVSWGWFRLSDTGVLTWVILFMLSFLLAVGLSWSHIRRRVAGQTDVDEVTEK